MGAAGSVIVPPSGPLRSATADPPSVLKLTVSVMTAGFTVKPLGAPL
jgi:hypothetical protein